MQFYSGFCLRDEEFLFESFLDSCEYVISGFSYGAIKAFRDAKVSLEMGRRVDTLQLISPAFFQTKPSRFKRLQTISFSRDARAYKKQFIDGCFHPHAHKEIGLIDGTKEELQELLNYEWSLQELQKLVESGVKIEVYLGARDAIVDVENAREFFLQVATVTYIKDANHFLQTN